MSKQQNAPIPDLFSSSKPPNVDRNIDVGVGELHPPEKMVVRKRKRSARQKHLKPSNQALETGCILPADEKYLTDKELAVRFGVSRPTIWRWRDYDFGFPQPVQISPGTTRWRLSDTLQFEQQLAIGNKNFSRVQQSKRASKPETSLLNGRKGY